MTGIFGGLLTLYILFGFGPLTRPMLFLGAIPAAMYWLTMALAPLFPGTAWYDPEFKNASARPGGFSPQQILTYALLALVGVGLVVATI